MYKEKIIIVSVNIDKKFSKEEMDSKIEELKELVRAANGEVIFTVIQNLDQINSKYFIGKGKVEEIRELAKNHEADTIVVNHELTGSQIKNLEDIIDKKIIDRTGLILDIFAMRAKTREAKLQIQLAQLEYRLPRLIGFRNYLSREGGGIGTRGPGEQKLETDRRIIQREISQIKNRLREFDKKRSTKRKRRVQNNIPIVSLIGYSNSGKSTILNQLKKNFSSNKKEVYSDNLLFATLDTSSANIELSNGKSIIVSDTVGFVSDLPTKLIESFKSTLEEIEYSNLLIIVVDSSNPNYQMQIEATNAVLKDMQLFTNKKLYVFNKMDLNRDFVDYNNYENEIYISALDEKDLNLLEKQIQKILYEDYFFQKVFVRYENYDKIRNIVVDEKLSNKEYTYDGIIVEIYVNKKELKKYSEFFEVIDEDGNKKRV